MSQEFNFSYFKMGYIILYANNGSKFGNLIEARQRDSGFIKDHAKYTHSEILGGRIYDKNRIPIGIRSVNIAPPISKLIDVMKVHKGREVRVVKYKADDFEDRRKDIAYISATLCNKNYDVRGILSFVFKWIKQDNRLYFCSEGVADSLQREYPKAFFPELASDIMPAHFCLPCFETVWKGKIP